MTDLVAMTRLSLCGTDLVLASVVMFAQPPHGGGPGPVLGIVEIPEMFLVDPNSGQYASRAALTLYTRQSPSANTHTAPPSGTSGNSPGRMALSRFCIPRASMPHPDCTATY
jgi:hypothetical protein